MKQFFTINILAMEAIFAIRLGCKIYKFLVGPDDPKKSDPSCELDERHIQQYLAPYYILVIGRFLIYHLIAKYGHLINND